MGLHNDEFLLRWSPSDHEMHSASISWYQPFLNLQKSSAALNFRVVFEYDITSFKYILVFLSFRHKASPWPPFSPVRGGPNFDPEMCLKIFSITCWIWFDIAPLDWKAWTKRLWSRSRIWSILKRYRVDKNLDPRVLFVANRYFLKRFQILANSWSLCRESGTYRWSKQLACSSFENFALNYNHSKSTADHIS